MSVTHLARRLLIGWLLLGLLAPLLVGDVPLLARVDGSLQAPLLSGARAPGEALTWKAWWAGLPTVPDAGVAGKETGDDWALFPLWPQGPQEVAAEHFSARPSWSHPCGVDDVGRDQLARLVYGARTAALVAGGAVALAMLLGLMVGGLAGLRGGGADAVALRLIELFTCFPAILALLTVQSVIGGGALVVIVVLGLVQWPAVARVVRGELLALRARRDVEAARGFSESWVAILGLHLAPDLRGPLGVVAAILAVEAILAEATLGFLGFGLQPAGGVSWGAMLDAGRQQAHLGAWHLWLLPATALAVAALTLHAAVDRRAVR